jgi:N-acetyl-gamma-glutamyl-phosphate reductase
MQVRKSVGIAGASGYAGGELLRLVGAHPSLALGPVVAGSAAGRPVADLHPHLPEWPELSFRATDPAVLAEADLVLTALPHGQSAALVQRLPAGLPVVDLSPDFRLASSTAWATYYGGEHAGTWPYGLPELLGTRGSLVGATRVANPGCYATAVSLALAPLLGARLVEPADLVVVAASGTSGAGRGAAASLPVTEVMGSVTSYKTGGVHQHTPEIEQALGGVAGEPVTLSFTPLLAPMPRGILATCTARLVTGAAAADAREAVVTAYAQEPFVTVLPEGRWPRTGATLGSNSVHLQVRVGGVSESYVAYTRNSRRRPLPRPPPTPRQ